VFGDYSKYFDLKTAKFYLDLCLFNKIKRRKTMRNFCKISMLLFAMYLFNLNISNAKENIYEEIKIGKQIWMVKNLDVAHYKNGDEILYAKTNEEWLKAAELGKGAWCYFNNASGLGEIYGVLYNWYAVNDPRGLAPDGWRVATDEDWNELENFYGSRGMSGDYLKQSGTLFWKSPNEGANNASGFTALPGGNRDGGNAYFNYLRFLGQWWTATPSGEKHAISRAIYYTTGVVTRGDYVKSAGYSVRSIKAEK
jgi:uncharacterized protein (TIGR02145 family)